MMWGYMGSCCGTGSVTRTLVYGDVITIEDAPLPLDVTEVTETLHAQHETETLHTSDDSQQIGITHVESIAITDDPDKVE